MAKTIIYNFEIIKITFTDCEFYAFCLAFYHFVKIFNNIILILNFFMQKFGVLKFFHYLCNEIQVNIADLSVIGTLFGYNGLDFLFIQVYTLALLNPVKPFNSIFWKRLRISVTDVSFISLSICTPARNLFPLCIS